MRLYIPTALKPYRKYSIHVFFFLFLLLTPSVFASESLAISAKNEYFNSREFVLGSINGGQLGSQFNLDCQFGLPPSLIERKARVLIISGYAVFSSIPTKNCFHSYILPYLNINHTESSNMCSSTKTKNITSLLLVPGLIVTRLEQLKKVMVLALNDAGYVCDATMLVSWSVSPAFVWLENQGKYGAVRFNMQAALWGKISNSAMIYVLPFNGGLH